MCVMSLIAFGMDEGDLYKPTTLIKLWTDKLILRAMSSKERGELTVFKTVTDKHDLM